MRRRGMFGAAAGRLGCAGAKMLAGVDSWPSVRFGGRLGAWKRARECGVLFVAPTFEVRPGNYSQRRLDPWSAYIRRARDLVLDMGT